MPIGAAAGAGLLGAGASIFGASKAADSSKYATDQAIAYQKQIRSDVQPWVQGGAAAFGNLSDPNKLMANFYTSPGYQFRLTQGLNAVGTDKAVNGLLQSGSALKSLNNYAAGQASSEFGNYVSQQQYLSNAGLNAEGIASGAANQSSNAALVNGANQGNAALTMGNQFSNLIGGLYKAYSSNQTQNTGGSSYGG